MNIRTLMLIALICGPAALAEPLRPLEDPQAWKRDSGSAVSFTIEEGTLHIKQGQSEPSAILTREQYENFHGLWF